MKGIGIGPAGGLSMSRTLGTKVTLAGRTAFLPNDDVPFVMQKLTMGQIDAIPKDRFSVALIEVPTRMGMAGPGKKGRGGMAVKGLQRMKDLSRSGGGITGFVRAPSVTVKVEEDGTKLHNTLISLAKRKEDKSMTNQMSAIRIALFIVLGLGALIGGGELFVKGACGIAKSAGVSEAVIGLTLVAGGTSLPELATSIVAARKGQSALAIGNVVGSNIFNIFFILGVCATVKPLAVTGLTTLDFAFLTASALLFWLFSRSCYKLSRGEGIVMILAYILYIVWLVTDKNI